MIDTDSSLLENPLCNTCLGQLPRTDFTMQQSCHETHVQSLIEAWNSEHRCWTKPVFSCSAMMALLKLSAMAMQQQSCMKLCSKVTCPGFGLREGPLKSFLAGTQQLRQKPGIRDPRPQVAARLT